MSHFRILLSWVLPLFAFGTVAVSGVAAAQNTWEAFWNSMESGLVSLGTNPSQYYFNTLYHGQFPDRERVFQTMYAEAHALSDIKVEYPIFIFDRGHAAYQRVVTGIFTKPYVSGNTTLPPTNDPVRFVTQGIIEIEGAGHIISDLAVTDGFAKFQEFGAISLAPGEEHGQIGLEPYAASDEVLSYQPPSDFDTYEEIARLLTVDENGNDATAADFDPTRIAQSWSNALSFSEPPVVTLAAKVTQDHWTAGSFTFATQPGTNIAVDIFDAPLTTPDPIEFPAFVFLHTNVDGTIDLMITNYDLLSITNPLRINPTTIALKASDSPVQSLATAPLSPLPTSTPRPNDPINLVDPRDFEGGSLFGFEEVSLLIEPTNINELRLFQNFTVDEVENLVRTAITPDLSENSLWAIQTAQSGVFLQKGGNAVFNGTLAAAYRPGSGVYVVDTLTNQPLASFASDLTEVPDLIFDPNVPLVYVNSSVGVRAYNYETGEQVILEGLAEATAFDVTWDGTQQTVTQVVGNEGGVLTVVTSFSFISADQPSVRTTRVAIDTQAGADLKRILLSRDGTQVIALDASNQLIGVWDTVTGEQYPFAFGETTGQTITAVNADISGTVMVATEDGQIEMFDVAGGLPVNQLNVGTEPIINISVSPNNTLIGAYSADNTLTIFGICPSDESDAGQNRKTNLHSLPRATLRRLFSLPVVSVLADGVMQGTEPGAGCNNLPGGEATDEPSSEESETGDSSETLQATDEPIPEPTPILCFALVLYDTNIVREPASTELVFVANAGVQLLIESAMPSADGDTWLKSAGGGWINSYRVLVSEDCKRRLGI